MDEKRKRSNAKSSEIKYALSIKHCEDAFFTEVKNGPTHTSNDLLIMDAIAIKKSWVHPEIIGYEVKVDRQDFMRDEKWHGYLSYCNTFSFVCPKGLILPEELPQEVGLLYYNPEKKSLTTKKKPIYREIEYSISMLLYVIMCKLDNERYPFFSNKKDFFEAWLEKKKEWDRYGVAVSNRMTEYINELKERVDDAERLSERYKEKAEAFERVKLIAREAGITSTWNFEEQLRTALKGGLTSDLKYSLNQIIRHSKDIEKLMTVKEEGDVDA